MNNNPLYMNWVPIQDVREFFKYKETQMKSLLKLNNIKVSKIGNRRFIEVKSINDLLKNNIVSNNK